MPTSWIFPFIGAPISDSAMSPETVVLLGKHGGLGVLDLEGMSNQL